MTKDGLEGEFRRENILSERAVFKEYMAYVNGELPDELGTRGKRIIDQADTISKNLGYSDISKWLDSFKKSNANIIPIERIVQIEKDYRKISRLGKSLREINQAVSIIEEHGDIYGVSNDGSLFLKSYEKKKEAISNMKKYCRTVLYLKNQPTIKVR